MQPEPAEVMAWRYTESATSPAANTPGMLVAVALPSRPLFTVKSGKIQEVQAVLVNRNDSQPTGWPTHWFGPGKGGWKNLPTGQ